MICRSPWTLSCHKSYFYHFCSAVLLLIDFSVNLTPLCPVWGQQAALGGWLFRPVLGALSHFALFLQSCLRRRRKSRKQQITVARSSTTWTRLSKSQRTSRWERHSEHPGLGTAVNLPSGEFGCSLWPFPCISCSIWRIISGDSTCPTWSSQRTPWWMSSGWVDSVKTIPEWVLFAALSLTLCFFWCTSKWSLEVNISVGKWKRLVSEMWVLPPSWRFLWL